MAGSSKPSKKRSAAPGRANKPASRRPETGQVGKRPSNPSFLILVGLAWVACGVVALLALSASWKIVPAVFFIGVGLFFLRGAATTLTRHEEHRGD